MIKKLKIKGCKSLKGVEIEFEPLGILFGPNTAENRNFLDALNTNSGHT